ncbi:MAG: cytochrome c biogenesis protein CcdA [candidate division Zixibacteria bacterium]|nr:cytochrome c biogenesis protein CcdA [candidate division Zixibacteria bacterium]
MKIIKIAIIASFLFPILISSVFPQLGNQSKFNVDDELVGVSSVFSMTSAKAGKNYQAVLVANVSPGWHINSATPYEDWLIAATIEFDTLDGITPHSILYPKPEDEILLDEKFSVYSGKTIIPFEISFSENLPNGEYTLPIKLNFQPCNNKECRAPETKTANLKLIVGEKEAYANKQIFANLQTSDNIDGEIESAPISSDNEIQRLIDEYGFWGYIIALGLAFITGLLLSFSPCTYPMVPITVSIFAGQNRSIGKGFIMSLFYVGSMAFVYGLMGMIVSMVGGVFGAWLASPPVVIGIVVVFIIFSLSMFGLYELNVPMSLRQKMGTKAGGGGILGAIVLGIIAALVVSPCVGPFVAGILLYVATSGSPIIGFLVLFVFAMGLGTLYIIIGTFSSAINKLPNSGEWMDTVKKFFGFVLLVMALYFLSAIISTILTALLASILLLAFGIFGGGLDRLTPESGFFLRLKKFIGFISLIIGTYLILGVIVIQGFILPPLSQSLPAINATSSEPKELIEWERDLHTGLSKALNENKPVIVDTWATWCANCKVLDKKTFGNQEVAKEAKRFISIKAQLETADSPTTKEFMKRFGMKHYTLPTTLLLDSKGNVKKILRGVIDPDDFVKELKKIS